MKLAISAIPVVALLTVIGVGCQNAAKKPPTAGASALDVTPPAGATAAYTATPSYTPPATPAYVPPASPVATGPQFTEPAVPDTALKTSTPSGNAKYAVASDVSGTSYTVQKGDTLSKIARDHYGNPSKWKQIAAANPGINPNGLKVGQRLVMP